MNYKINEIFESIQGEGFYTGQHCLFVRFAGCNLKCFFCDTSHDAFFELSHDSLLNEVEKHNCKHVILTGGEPALQVNQQIINDLHSINRFIHIETNGTITLPKNIDWVTVSPKTADFKIMSGHELKLVYGVFDNIESIRKQTDFKYYFIQPESNKKINEIIDILKDNQEWRLSLQIHKILKIH